MKTNRFLFFIIAWAGMVFYISQRTMYGTLIPSLFTHFGVDKASLGLVGSASFWGYTFTPILGGLLSDRMDRKKIVLFGIFGFSLLTVLCGFVSNITQLFVLRFITGFVEGFFFVPLISFILELFPERPGFFLTLISSGASFGIFTGPALSGYLLSQMNSWSVPFFIIGGAGIIVTFFLFLCWPHVEKAPYIKASFKLSALKGNYLMMLILLCCVSAFQLLAEFSFIMWYPVYLKTEAAIGIAAAGTLAGMFGLGQFFGRPLNGWLADQLSYRKFGIGGALMMGLWLILAIYSHSLLLKVIFTFLSGLFGAAVMGSLWTYTGLVFDEIKGLALGILTSVGFLCSSAGPILVGSLGDHYSIATGLLWVCVPAPFFAAIFFALTYAIRLKKRSSKSQPSRIRLQAVCQEI